ncbi:hypothetical protein B0T25DRAFT_78558 [Lasiosphaeria hispida]|uniref:Uncharacterized protein n=1 Tax=Lasiosphaeria hispida TaxID=260671 RepID=A0AAJ0HPK6_9PEZI|nr:hypothetical protein B0T25DRAFT_78558 [Lasiosphaeria hispida]
MGDGLQVSLTWALVQRASAYHHMLSYWENTSASISCCHCSSCDGELHMASSEPRSSTRRFQQWPFRMFEDKTYY